MSAFVGRQLTITRTGSGPGPATITGKLNKSLSLNNGEIDITGDDDDGFRTLLESAAVRSIDISFDGVLKDDQILALLADGPVQGTYSIDLGTIGVFAGTFQFADIELSAEHSGPTAYSAVMKSSGAFTYTPDSTV